MMRPYLEVLTTYPRMHQALHRIDQTRDLRHNDNQPLCSHLRYGNRRVRPFDGGWRGRHHRADSRLSDRALEGTVLFDTGPHPDCQHDPAGRLGERLAGLFRIGFQPGEEVSARLEAIDRDPGKIGLIINSHFQFDHVGGNPLIPNATMLVQRREWKPVWTPKPPRRAGSIRAISTSAINCGSSMASTTCLAMARWCVCRHTGTRRGTNPFDYDSIAAVSCSPRTPATFVRPSASAACRATCTVVRACCPRLTGWRRWNGAGRASFSATTRSSGKRYRRHRSRSHNADARSCAPRRRSYIGMPLFERLCHATFPEVVGVGVSESASLSHSSARARISVGDRRIL